MCKAHLVVQLHLEARNVHLERSQPPIREHYPIGDISTIYIAGSIQRLGHATLASDIGRIRSVVPGTSGIFDNDDDNNNDNDNDNGNDNDGTFVEQNRSQYI